MIISLDADKAFDKFQQPFLLKVLQMSVIQGSPLHIEKAIYSNPVVNIKLDDEKHESIHLKPRMRQGCPLSPYYSI